VSLDDVDLTGIVPISGRSARFQMESDLNMACSTEIIAALCLSLSLPPDQFNGGDYSWKRNDYHSSEQTCIKFHSITRLRVAPLTPSAGLAITRKKGRTTKES
jgi:hypothetical protein